MEHPDLDVLVAEHGMAHVSVALLEEGVTSLTGTKASRDAKLAAVRARIEAKKARGEGPRGEK